jgi:peptidoglycan hydrolase-like protein with peptidoglycan-binding domain
LNRRFLTTVAALAAGSIAILPAPAEANHFGKRTLKSGMRGHDVRVLQDYLTRAGFKTSVDGQFGRATRKSQRRWERAGVLKVDGKATISDQRRLLSTPAAPSSAPAAAAQPAAPTEQATLAADGTAVAPASAPDVVKAIIAAGNEIHDKPYKYGGGHGKWQDSGYDCSGSMSYALHGAGLLDEALDSTGFMSWGKPGKGQWVTLYANSGHSYMVVAGLRFDTSGRSADGSRWHADQRSASGYTIRHIDGL